MKTKNRTKLKPATKHTTDLVWVDVAQTSSPSDALAYGFMSPDLIPIVNRLLNKGLVRHSVVIGGTCYAFEKIHHQILGNTTKWEEVSK
jgi:hypothetical protein